MKNNQCPKCKSVKRASSLAVRDFDAASRQPLAMGIDSACLAGGERIYKGLQSSEMRAWMCGNCGFTEFYAPRQTKTSSIYKQSRF